MLLRAFSDMMSFHFSGVQVSAVDSGPVALDALQQQEYDIVICDLMMPGMDGAMTLTEIRKRHPHVRAYLMTGHPRPEEVYKHVGATGFLQKPLDRTFFLDFMRRTIQSVSMGKKAVSQAIRASEQLSSSMQRHADVEHFLQRARPSSDGRGKQKV
jgi:CheY-like chemotaxis protein